MESLTHIKLLFEYVNNLNVNVRNGGQFKEACNLFFFKSTGEGLYRVAKKQGERERGSHEVKTRRTNCDPDCKKYYRIENICLESNIQNVQNENIYRCVTYIYIYILVRQKVL